MSDQDLDEAGFRAFLKAAGQGPESLQQVRARLDRRIEVFPLPSGCSVEPAELAGVACERLTPISARAGRTLLYFHGGGYTVGSPRSHRFVAANLADRAACRAVVPDYRLAPEHRFPAAIDDAFAVYCALAQSGAAVVIAGDSAGGGLALATALKARDAGAPRAAGLLLVSPWVDLLHQGDTYTLNAHLDPMTVSELEAAAAGYAGGADLKNPAISPLYADLSGLPPMMIQVGADEMLLSDSTRLAAHAAQAKADVALRVYPRLIHNFATHMAVLANARLAMAEAGDWIGGRYGSSSPL